MALNYNPSIVNDGLIQYLDPAISASQFEDNITVCATANENQTLSITAPDGYVFSSVDFASYGNPTGECELFAQGACHAANSQSIVEGYLLGNTGTITIPATNAVFGDPCVGTFKRLYVEATITGLASNTISNVVGGNSIWTLNQLGVGTTAGTPTFESNVQSNGSGTSFITAGRDSRLETGSLTFQIWFNLKGIPLNVGSNNNWRGMLPSAADPLRIVLEQSYVLNFSTRHTDNVYRRRLNNSFAPLGVDADGWQMVTFTYDQATGEAACYKNAELVRSGPMTVTSSGGTPTTAGLGLRYNNYVTNGFKIYGEGNTSSNPAGRGHCPGEFGNILIYNVALTQEQVRQNYLALRGRYR